MKFDQVSQLHPVNSENLQEWGFFEFSGFRFQAWARLVKKCYRCIPVEFPVMQLAAIASCLSDVHM